MSLRIFRTFKCVEVEGKFWLAADLRLACYDSTWCGGVPHAHALSCFAHSSAQLGALTRSCTACVCGARARARR